MIKLNDYLYSGDTVLKILQCYADGLRLTAKETHNEIDRVHCYFYEAYERGMLLQQLELSELDVNMFPAFFVV